MSKSDIETGNELGLTKLRHCGDVMIKSRKNQISCMIKFL